MIAIVELTLTDLGLAALLVLANAAVDLTLRLGLGRRLLLAAARATVQLALLGWVLGLVFRTEGPGAVVLVALVMGTVAGIEAVRRAGRRLPGIFAASVGVMLVSSLTVTAYGLLVVLDTPGPWYAPQYAIPLLGMVLGNALNGISLGLDAALEGFDEDRERVELRLAHGATRRQAAAPVLRRAARRGMIPILNAMVAVGVISVPGMMTGQLLAGEDPETAARYQLFILFAIAGGVALGTVGVVLAAERLVFDDRDRLRADRIRRVDA